MAGVTGIGGVFFESRDPDALAQWYRSHLNLPVNEEGAADLEWRHRDDPGRIGRTVWGLFPSDTDYFGAGAQPFMINYRVDDLDGRLAELRDEGVPVEDEIEEYEYGRFAWVTDPAGNRIELWEPVDSTEPAG